MVAAGVQMPVAEIKLQIGGGLILRLQLRHADAEAVRVHIRARYAAVRLAVINRNRNIGAACIRNRNLPAGVVDGVSRAERHQLRSL